jgi:DNA helicase-2/ATP-dependent DNA helicase PcrA
VSLVSDVEARDEKGGAVTLMTLHSAKGLEFPAVAMIGLEEGCLPHARVQDHPQQLEEERRLCFVGITRAEQKLIMSQAAVRQIRGLRERTVPSRFLGEMPRELIDVIAVGGAAGSRWAEPDYDGADEDSPAGRFATGQAVRHPQFGKGKIVDLVEMGRHTRVVVEFSAVGRKTLILEYARLEAAG